MKKYTSFHNKSWLDSMCVPDYLTFQHINIYEFDKLKGANYSLLL